MKTVDKAMTLLRQFSLEHLEIGLNDLARATGEDKAVTRRLLLSLIKHGFIEQNPENRKYRLGHGFLSLARLREATVPMVKATQVVTQWLSAQASETVHVGIPGETGMSTASFTLPPRGNVINFRPAETYPFHSSSSGLAFLSFCSADTRERLLNLKREKLTRFTVTDRDALLTLIAQTRGRGYAFSSNTVDEGVASVAMPYFADGKDPAGTIAIAVPDHLIDEPRREELAALLGTAIEKLEIALTGHSRLSTPR
ncbi:IclR family transcriptional regulator [Ruegeria halocynthiae]|uniref:IclR family transcriptional regulator n=1 Tax=Ruegeria halocynthiae TaxID=985054 RepID=UPI00068A1A07|nr:IclR family transcriptional regulator [Ruegeria halocynthiae]